MSCTYRRAIPAFLTAVEIAFTAVKMAFISCVKSPVACGNFRCSARRNLVIVMQSVSILLPVLVILQFGCFCDLKTTENGELVGKFHLQPACPCQLPVQRATTSSWRCVRHQPIRSQLSRDAQDPPPNKYTCQG